MYFRGLSGTRKPLKTLAFFGYLVVQGLHRREKDDLADGAGIRQQHHTAVNAHTHAARRGHAVFQSRQEILVQHLGLVVAALALLRLLDLSLIHISEPTRRS